MVCFRKLIWGELKIRMFQNKTFPYRIHSWENLGFINGHHSIIIQNSRDPKEWIFLHISCFNSTYALLQYVARKKSGPQVAGTNWIVNTCILICISETEINIHINILDELIGFPFHAQYNFKLKLIMKMRLEILIHYAKIRVYMVHGIPRVYICD